MILVTGGTGLVGSFLLRELVEHGEEVRAIRRSASSWSLVEDLKDRVDWVDADLLDIPALEGAFADVSTVYHSGAMVSYLKREVPLMMRTNVEGTANIVNLCLAKSVSRLCHVSSIAALGRTARIQMLNEQAVWEKSRYNPPYAVSKHLAEREVWRGSAEGLSTVIVNPSVVFGPGQWDRAGGRVFPMIRNGLKFYPANATGFVDVRDVVLCMIELTKSDTNSERFVLNAENRPMKEVFDLIAQSLKKKPPKYRAFPLAVQVMLLTESFRGLFGKPPRYTRALARNAFSEHSFDNSKVRERLGFNFKPLQDTIRWVADNLPPK